MKLVLLQLMLFTSVSFSQQFNCGVTLNKYKYFPRGYGGVSLDRELNNSEDDIKNLREAYEILDEVLEEKGYHYSPWDEAVFTAGITLYDSEDTSSVYIYVKKTQSKNDRKN